MKRVERRAFDSKQGLRSPRNGPVVSSVCGEVRWRGGRVAGKRTREW